MCEVTGPISTLPGTHYPVPEGTMCDVHPTHKAVARIQGETDSMGAELNDMCATCVAESKAPVDTSGNCDWCKQFADKRRPCRDYEEGTSGRIYDVCEPCIKAQQDEAQRELEARGYWDDDCPDYDYPEEDEQPVVETPKAADRREHLLADYSPSDPIYRVTLECKKNGEMVTPRTYYVKARDAKHALARAGAMLPAPYYADSFGLAVLHVVKPAAQLRAERDEALRDRGLIVRRST